MDAGDLIIGVFVVLPGMVIGYLLYVFIICRVFKSEGDDSFFSVILQLLLIIAPLVFAFAPKVFKHRKAMKRNEAISQKQKKSDNNRKKACSLEHKLSVFKKIPKESGILFSLPKKDKRSIGYYDISHYLHSYAKVAFTESQIESQIESGNYTRENYSKAALLSDLTDKPIKITLEETMSQFRFSIEEVTTEEDKEKLIHRIQMTLKNRETNELMARYISFYSPNLVYRHIKSSDSNGCLEYDVSNKKASNPLYYFFREALDETKIQPFPITHKNKDPFYMSKGFDEVGAFHDDLAVVQKNGKKGFINREGEIVIPIKFNDVTRFIEKRAIIRENEKWGVIDTQGKIILPTIYDVIEPYPNSLIFVKKQGEWSLVILEGNIVRTAQFSKVKEFKKGFDELTEFEGNGYHGMVNSQGDIIVPAMYHSVKYYPQYDLIHVRKSGKKGLINTDGKLVFPLTDSLFFYDKYELFKIRKKGKEGLINVKGELVIPIKFNSIIIFDTTFATVKYNRYSGVYNIKTGEEIVPVIYKNIRATKHGVFEVRKDNKEGLINTKGDFVIPIDFSEINVFDNNFTRVKSDGNWGVNSTQTGKEIVPTVYDDIRIKHNVFEVEKDKKIGMLDFNGNFVIPMGFEKINVIDEHFTKVKFYDGWGIRSTKTGKVIVPAIYDDVRIKNDVFEVEKDKKIGVINPSGEVIVPAIYDRINIKYGIVTVTKDKKNGVINSKGIFIIPMIVDKITVVDENYTIVKSGSYLGIRNTQTGKEIVPAAYNVINFFKNRPNIIETRKQGKVALFNIETGIPILLEGKDGDEK